MAAQLLDGLAELPLVSCKTSHVNQRDGAICSVSAKTAKFTNPMPCASPAWHSMPCCQQGIGQARLVCLATMHWALARSDQA